MPAIKNDRMKRTIEDYHNCLIPSTSKFTIRNSMEKEACFSLMIYKKKDAKETDPISEQYFVFTTNMHYSDARKLYPKIPLEYKMRWGIETGFCVQNIIKALTTSQNYEIMQSGRSTRYFQSSSITCGSSQTFSWHWN